MKTYDLITYIFVSSEELKKSIWVFQLEWVGVYKIIWGKKCLWKYNEVQVSLWEKRCNKTPVKRQYVYAVGVKRKFHN